MTDEQKFLKKTQVRSLIVEHELQRFMVDLAQQVRNDVTNLKGLTGNQLRLSQVRSLANALAPAGASDSPQLRLARLHELAAGQLQRREQKLPPAITRFDPKAATSHAPAELFWLYVAGRLAGLRSGDDAHPGDLERLCKRIKGKYPDLWPEGQPDAPLRHQLHLRLAETVIYNLVETWEYANEEVMA